MNRPRKQVQDGSRVHGFQITGYKCPSCNMVAWHNQEDEVEVFCSFCSHALPRYVTQISPERMIMMDAAEQSKIEKQFGHSTHRREVQPVEQVEGASPFILEFFMVQGAGYVCMAYRNNDGKWRGAFDNKELPGKVRVLE